MTMDKWEFIVCVMMGCALYEVVKNVLIVGAEAVWGWLGSL